MGTYAVAWFLPTSQSHDTLAGQIVQCAGLGLQIYAMLSLNRSIGVVGRQSRHQDRRHVPLGAAPALPELRGRIRRLSAQHPSYYNAAVYSGAVLLWVLRIMAEERLLLGDEGYRQYAGRVRWRLIPFVF